MGFEDFKLPSTHVKKAGVLADYRAGMPVGDVLAKWHVSSASLYRWLALAGATNRYNSAISTDAVLTTQQIRKAVAMFIGKPRRHGRPAQPGLKIFKIAREFKVSPVVLKEILKPHILNARGPGKNTQSAEERRELYDRITSMLARRKTREQIAKATGVSLSHVYRVCPAAKRESPAEARRIQLVLWHDEHPNSTFEKTAAKFGVSVSTVKYAVYSAGKISHKIETTAKKKRRMRAQTMYEEGWSMARIAKKLHCSQRWLGTFLPKRTRSQVTKLSWKRRHMAPGEKDIPATAL